MSGAVDRAKLEPGQDARHVVVGFRLLGQSFTADSAAFQMLVYDSVGAYEGDGGRVPRTSSVAGDKRVRGVPSVLDLAAALGSEKARKILGSERDDRYEGYSEQLAKAGALLDGPARLPNSAGDVALRALHLSGSAPTETGLWSGIGLWVRTRHDLVLYAKQSYTISEKSLQRVQPRTTASVEPAIATYGALIEALQATGAMLRAAMPSSSTPESARVLKQNADIVDLLRRIRAAAEVVGASRSLSADDVAFLNEVDERLLRCLSGPDAPVVVDFHTDAIADRVLHVGIGYPELVAQDGDRGGRFRIYEFTEKGRWTDERWQKHLESGVTIGELLSGNPLPAGVEAK
jgi:hypothetical protein